MAKSVRPAPGATWRGETAFEYDERGERDEILKKAEALNQVHVTMVRLCSM